jgi:hypothetical protein
MSWKIRFVSVILTISILSLMLIAGPAQAFILGLSVSNTNVVSGQEIEFTATAEIESGEIIDVEYIILDLSGPVSTSCIFLPNGTKITGCSGMTIKQISTTNYTYGYGYGYQEGNLTYNITLKTDFLADGTYSTNLLVIEGKNTYSQRGEDITISTNGVILELCSIRSKGGTAEILGENFEHNNQLNFNIPKEGAVIGAGILSARYDRKRFFYQFDIVKTTENNEQNASIIVNGRYRINREDEVEEQATIYVDKKNKKLSVIGSDIGFTNMDVNFIRGCK